MGNGTINTQYRGFAVDNNGSLYVGKFDRIDVYKNSEFVKTFCTVYSQTYGLTIQDEKLYVADGLTIKVMELSGNLIKTYNDSYDASEMHRLQSQQNVFVTDSAKYVATDTLGFFKITRYSTDGGSEVVYQIPTLDFVFSWTPLIFVILIIVLVIGGIKWGRWRKKNYPEEGSGRYANFYGSLFDLIFRK